MADFPIMPVFFDTVDLSPSAQAKRDAINSLAELVSTRWKLSMSSKVSTGVVQDIEECRRAMAGAPISGSHIDPDLPVVLNVTASIAEGMHALIIDAMAVSAENLFTIKATPSPELPPSAQQDIMRQLQDQMQAMASLGVETSMSDLSQMAEGIAKAVQTEAKRRAGVAAEELRIQVQDMLVEGEFRKAMNAAVLDYVSSMAMIIKAPAVMPKLVRTWDGDRMSFKKRLVRGVERIDPACFALSPGGMDPQSAEWTVEQRRIQPHDLMELANDPNYDADEIRRVFTLYPSGYVEIEDNKPSFMIQDTAAYTRSFAYDAVETHGLIKGSVLQAMGLTVGDTNRAYEAIIIAIGKCVIAAMVNTDATGRRPYHMRSFFTSPTSPWGGGPTSRLRPLQRVITSLFIALGGDAALAGVHVELDPAMLHKDDKMAQTAVRPRTVRLVKTSMAGTRDRAYDIKSVTTQIAAFQQEIANLHAMAYEIVGIPRMALGQTSGAGTLGRTSGGVASMLNQATKGTRRAILDLEEDVIEPTVQGFLDYIMMFRAPKNFKGDVNAQARGLSGLVEQASAAEDLVQALNLIGPLEGKNNADSTPVIPPGATARLVYRIFKAKGIPTEGLFTVDYDTEDALRGATASPMAPVSASGFGPSGPTSLGQGLPPPAPALNPSQSPAAAGAIAASNAPMG